MSRVRAALTTLLLAAGTACNSPAPQADVPEHYPIVERIRVHEMPRRLVEQYETLMQAEEPPNSGFYYRAGTLESEIAVYQTSEGRVYVDFGGGGNAFAIDCATLTDFVNRNAWNAASGCLEGQR